MAGQVRLVNTNTHTNTHSGADTQRLFSRKQKRSVAKLAFILVQRNDGFTLAVTWKSQLLLFNFVKIQSKR